MGDRGYKYAFDEIFIDHRPVGARGFAWTYFDDISISRIGVIPGDLDLDGDVDFTDFSVLSGNFTGTLDPNTGVKLPEEGDIDGDGDVDFSDFSVLSGNFTGTLSVQAPTTGTATSVPTPATLALLLLAGFAVRRRVA